MKIAKRQHMVFLQCFAADGIFKAVRRKSLRKIWVKNLKKENVFDIRLPRIQEGVSFLRSAEKKVRKSAKKTFFLRSCFSFFGMVFAKNDE